MNQQEAAAWELHLFLTELGVPYAIIGGMAVQRWGEARFTQDVDITIVAPLDRPVELIQQIVHRFPPRIPDAVAFARRNRVILAQARNGCPVDISLGLPGYEEEVMRRAVDFELEPGKRVRLCSAEDLIIHKAVAGRPQDMRDIEGIVYRQGDALDATYIRHWLAGFAEILADPEIEARFERPWRRRHLQGGATMRQLLVECSDPGLVISLAEELENVLRNIDFDRARALQAQLGDLARELGPEVAQAWGGFRLEVPGDGGCPPAFGNREGMKPDEKPLRLLLARAAERGLGKFELRWTCLLPQGGPEPETREQYVSDLADGIRYDRFEELGIHQMPTDLPAAMATHRERLMEEHVGGVLAGRARFPAVGYKWIQDSVEAVRKALEEVNTRAEAVMEYELGRVDPAIIEPPERIRWAALAIRLGVEFEKWYTAAEEPLSYLYQRVALLWHLSDPRGGWGRARSFMEQRFLALIEQARPIYTADGVAALQHIYDELHRSPWDRLPVPAEDEDEEQGAEGLLPDLP